MGAEILSHPRCWWTESPKLVIHSLLEWVHLPEETPRRELGARDNVGFR